jgi:predicted membrane channel-forming protein YqfA (hemolysin III family)
MSLAHRYLLFGAGWFFSVPLLAVPVFAVSAFDGNVAVSTLVSAVWTLGLVGIFWVWASKDAVTLGKSKNVARWFTAAWFVLLVIAVFPYLFVTRGFKNGLVASLQFACYLLACGIVFVGAPWLVFRMIS